MSNPPLHIKAEVSAGSHILSCFDNALDIATKLNAVVNFDFNGVYCGVRPSDATNAHRDAFEENYTSEMRKTSGLKICYANLK